ncbi:MAG TPA: ABC transporter permease [Acidimicrobiales bacterium]|nr:ABC transporter permease [Acidimicrobiales bacterium]
MRYAVIGVALALAVGVRLWRRRRTQPGGYRLAAIGQVGGVTGLVAEREIRERFRSRMFKVGTGIVLLVVVAAIVIPVLRKGQHSHQQIGVVGTLPAQARATILAAGASLGIGLTLVPEASTAAAEQDLKAGRVHLVVVDGRRLIVDRAISATDTSAPTLLVRLVATQIGLQNALEAAGLPPDRAAALTHPPPLPVTSMQPARTRGTAQVTAIYGLILLYVLLTQYGTWIMMGVVEEKSSRVVEVLLSTMKPAQLLAGKVIGIGTVALAQASVLVALALILAKAVGSDLLHGSAPLEVMSLAVWLVLGYAFYCWVYAAGGALADRQEHLQTLAFPLQIPILFGYITSITALGSANPSTLIHVLAYLPPTAPFAMSALVADGAVTWWQFVLSAALTLVSTVLVARLAATIYRRAVLRTGARVRVRDVLSRAAA